MHIITTAIIKGGTGKTTTTAALAQAAQAAGFRVLAIDLDPQGNLSRCLGMKRQGRSFELLTGEITAAEALEQSPQGMSVIASSADLSALPDSKGAALRLRKALVPIKDDFDFIFIDTAPDIGVLTMNALACATAVLIPQETDSGSVFGLHHIGNMLESVKKKNPELSFVGIIVTRFDPRPKINKHLQGIIADRAKDFNAVYLGAVRNGISVREAQATGQSLFEYDKHCNPAKDYSEIFAKLQQHLDAAGH